MRIRDIIFIMIGLMLFVFAVYFKSEMSKLEDENLELKTAKRSISQEFKEYKSAQIQKNLLRAKEEEQKIREEEKKLRTQKRKNLKIKVDTAYESAQNLYKKYRNTKCKEYIIKEALNQHLVFIKDYKGSLVGNVKDRYLKTQNRAIGLEEIQKVRKYHEGFIDIKPKDSNITQTIYVKDLDMYDWFIGISDTF